MHFSWENGPLPKLHGVHMKQHYVIPFLKSETGGTAVTQEQERVVYSLESWWLDPQFLWPACQSVTGQDTKPPIASNGCSINV